MGKRLRRNDKDREAYIQGRCRKWKFQCLFLTLKLEVEKWKLHSAAKNFFAEADTTKSCAAD